MLAECAICDNIINKYQLAWHYFMHRTHRSPIILVCSFFSHVSCCSSSLDLLNIANSHNLFRLFVSLFWLWQKKKTQIFQPNHSRCLSHTNEPFDVIIIMMGTLAATSQWHAYILNDFGSIYRCHNIFLLFLLHNSMVGQMRFEKRKHFPLNSIRPENACVHSIRLVLSLSPFACRFCSQSNTLANKTDIERERERENKAFQCNWDGNSRIKPRCDLFMRNYFIDNLEACFFCCAQTHTK